MPSCRYCNGMNPDCCFCGGTGAVDRHSQVAPVAQKRLKGKSPVEKLPGKSPVGKLPTSRKGLQKPVKGKSPVGRVPIRKSRKGSRLLGGGERFHP
jgi:hypothetical protein